MTSKRKHSFSGQFAGRLVEMLESPAFRQLTLSALRVIHRVEIENAHHGGIKDNGRLPVTFDDFEEYGIHRHAIAPAIREAVALGFLEITDHGRAGNAEWRKPNLFRLTFRPSKGNYGDGTHEWRKIATDEEARTIAAQARAPVPAIGKSQCRKTTNLVPGNRTKNTRSHSSETDTTGHGAETTTTFDISGKGAAA
jgi:hypothetical protein